MTPTILGLLSTGCWTLGRAGGKFDQLRSAERDRLGGGGEQVAPLGALGRYNPARPRCAGIVNVNVEPAPSWLFTQIRPPCSSTNFRHKVSPSPVPSIFFAAVPTCRNSSKTFS